MNIRPFKSEDAEDIFKIRAEAVVRVFSKEVNIDIVWAILNGYVPRDFIKMNGIKHDFYVGEIDNEVVGFFQLRQSPKTITWK